MRYMYKEAFSDIKEIEMNPLNKEDIDNNWISCMTISPDSNVYAGYGCLRS